MTHQRGIIEEVPPLARSQFFRLKNGQDSVELLKELAVMAPQHNVVVGLGVSLLNVLEINIPGMRLMPRFSGKGVDVPATPHALWCWHRGDDHGAVFHAGRRVQKLLEPAFVLDHVVDTFRYDTGRDLTGYEDGTENPQGNEASNVALVQSDDPVLTGSSFVTVQQWVHDLDGFDLMSPRRQDYTIGRERESNEELDDAPASAHVKRTAQESFSPEAFQLRRSMPWASEHRQGLLFVAFGNSFDPFEALMNRMVGADDGIVDALFDFSHPTTGSYFWCPSVHDEVLAIPWQ